MAIRILVEEKAITCGIEDRRRPRPSRIEQLTGGGTTRVGIGDRDADSGRDVQKRDARGT